MASPRTLPPEAKRILEVARSDRSAARRALSSLPVEQQVALVCESPLARRAELMALADDLASLVPALPPAELCHVAVAVGLSDAGWILEHASDSQIAAAIDLDAWQHLVPDRARLGEWLPAFADAGDATLLRAVHAVDAELLALHLKSRLEVFLKPPESEGEWAPPLGAQTLDGQFYLRAVDPKDDLGDLLALLRTLFERDYWFYFRLLQAVVWELDSDLEDWALRWRDGRLQDLGFPRWEEAMAIYGHLREDRLRALPETSAAAPVGEWPLPVWMPRLPTGGEADPLLFRAMAALPEEERRPYLLQFLALANRVAVADRMPLGDAESLPRATTRAATIASEGLEFLAREHGLEPVEVLRRAPLHHLFRVGALRGDPARRPQPADED